jgi:hypothetical protein
MNGGVNGPVNEAVKPVNEAVKPVKTEFTVVLAG